ncbi:cell wall-binding repeat-containing protein [Agrococcus sp. 1P02AA]|uniref:cell wall-binding repeat-containing protein n=1 Tax=Agrococcus sp. 1P02AA TaxID=3132259 RepID=UPI0039A73F62
MPVRPALPVRPSVPVRPALPSRSASTRRPWRRAALCLVSAAALLGSLLVVPLPGAAASAEPATARGHALAAASVPPTEIDECLMRSAIVPVAVDPAGDAAVARAAAMRTLQHALLTAGEGQLAGAELRHGSGGVIVGLDVVESQPGAAGRVAAAVVPTLPAAARALVQASDVAVTGQAEQPLRILCDSLDHVLTTTGAADGVVSAAVDHRAGVLRIGVDAATLARQAPAARGSIQRLPEAAEGEAAAPAAADLVSALDLEALAAPIELIADRADSAVSRLHDTDGWGGGNAIRVGAGGGLLGLACTTGFAVRTADGAPAVMSAGHCPGRSGGDGAIVVSGHAPALCGTGSGAHIGAVSQNLLATSARIDTMLIRTASARPTMWRGSACQGSAEAPVHGTTQIGPGQRVDFSGARQGERTATRTWEPAGCFDFGYWACSILRATSSAPATSAGYACLPGDSGGPAFRARPEGGVFALGIISASGYDLGINRCSWVDLETALRASGATIMTDASLTMPAPARLAGANRFETAAMVSRQGHPRGASEVWVASGQGFADALGAGAAAAHRRAPLLLTANGWLPDATRAELDRLRPTGIVLTGSTASVSAAVEEQLAEIAPVRRLGGANRYETSAAIAAFAFPEGAATAYVASGRLFADALASAPAAARAAAPVLIVSGLAGRPAEAATLDALDALGTSRVILVGGLPSVSAEQGEELGQGRALTRVHGRDRYETAALVNRVFGPTPPALYVASGQGFPDALATGAVAGMRGAPLFLTPSTCLSPHVVAAHTRLGSPEVWLLGSPTTLSHDITRRELC